MRLYWIFFLGITIMSCGEGSSTVQQEKKTASAAPILPVVDKVDMALKGRWQLIKLPQSSTPFDKLYPKYKPNILIEPEIQMVSGSTGCNRFSATLTTVGTKLRISNRAQSKIACVGEAELNFLKALDHSTNFSFQDPNKLVFGSDSVAWMVFERQ